MSPIDRQAGFPKKKKKTQSQPHGNSISHETPARSPNRLKWLPGDESDGGPPGPGEGCVIKNETSGSSVHFPVVKFISLVLYGSKRQKHLKVFAVPTC